MSQDKGSIETKVYKLPGGKEFIDEVVGLSIPQLDARILQMQKALEESEQHKEQNIALQTAKDEVAVLDGPYKDVKKAVKFKTKYLIALIKEKGGQ